MTFIYLTPLRPWVTWSTLWLFINYFQTRQFPLRTSISWLPQSLDLSSMLYYYYNIVVKSRDRGSEKNQKNDNEVLKRDCLVWKYFFELLNFIPLFLCHLACAMEMMWLSCLGGGAANALTVWLSFIILPSYFVWVASTAFAIIFQKHCLRRCCLCCLCAKAGNLSAYRDWKLNKYKPDKKRNISPNNTNKQAPRLV